MPRSVWVQERTNRVRGCRYLANCNHSLQFPADLSFKDNLNYNNPLAAMSNSIAPSPTTPRASERPRAHSLGPTAAMPSPPSRF
jgi:hypothetical protein